MNQSTVCVVGAGPAGVITSLLLAQQGVASTLVDKCTFPRHKACADTLPSSVIRQLQVIIPGFLEHLQLERTAKELKGTVLYSPAGDAVKVDFIPLAGVGTGAACYSIPRIQLDNELLAEAKKNPLITVLEGHEVAQMEREADGLRILFKHGKPELHVKLVVLCSGSNTTAYKNIHRMPTAENDYAVGLRGYFTHVAPGTFPEHSELYLLPDLMPGALFLAPLAGGDYNVNLVIGNEVVKKNKVNMNALLMEQLASNPVLKARFKDATLVGHLQGSRLFLGVKKRPISGDNFLMAGDAAGLIDLFSANGIPQAVVTARIASEYAVRCVLADNYSHSALAGYDAEVFQKVKKYLQLNAYISPLFAHPLSSKMLIRLINFLFRHTQQNNALRDLMYSKNRFRMLINPLFYGKLFFGKRNTRTSA